MLERQSDRALAGSVAVVTGASRGLGAAAAVELASYGAHIVLVGRTTGGLEETDDAIRSIGGTATLLPFDLRDAVEVDSIGPSLLKRFGRLDILVHAAGVLGKLTPVSHIMSDDWADVVGVNLTATWRLIRTCEPLLRRAGAARAVFVTDYRAEEPRAYWASYGATKAGMEYLVRTWAQELVTTSIRINLFDPGIMGTRLRREAYPGRALDGLPHPAKVAPYLAKLCLPSTERHGELVRVVLSAESG